MEEEWSRFAFELSTLLVTRGNKLYTRAASKRSHRAEMCPQHQHLDGSSVSQPIMTKLS